MGPFPCYGTAISPLLIDDIEALSKADPKCFPREYLLISAQWPAPFLVTEPIIRDKSYCDLTKGCWPCQGNRVFTEEVSRSEGQPRRQSGNAMEVSMLRWTYESTSLCFKIHALAMESILTCYWNGFWKLGGGWPTFRDGDAKNAFGRVLRVVSKVSETNCVRMNHYVRIMHLPVIHVPYTKPEDTPFTYKISAIVYTIHMLYTI